MTAITIEGVSRSFGDVRAVDAVTLAIRDGEFFTLLGPSGCGKTTLLRMVAGFCELDGGRILFAERRVDTVPPHRRNTGMVFQNYAVFPHLDVAGNVAYGLKARGLAQRDIAARVGRALSLVQLDGYARRWPHQLSGGQLQRVAIARAVVKAVSIPVIGGFGGGPWLDGRVRMAHAAIGYAEKWIDAPAETYANVAKVSLDALTALIADVRAGRQIKG